MGNNSDSNDAIVILILIMCVVFYFIFKMFILVGIGLAILGIVGLLLGFYMEEETVMIGSIISLVIGLVLFLIGSGRVGFFENNDIGKGLLDGGQTVVNTTVDTYEQVSQIQTEVNNAVIDTTKEINKR